MSGLRIAALAVATVVVAPWAADAGGKPGGGGGKPGMAANPGKAAGKPVAYPRNYYRGYGYGGFGYGYPFFGPGFGYGFGGPVAPGSAATFRPLVDETGQPYQVIGYLNAPPVVYMVKPVYVPVPVPTPTDAAPAPPAEQQ